MRLATIGFYYDFTRFFAALHGQTTPKGEVTEVRNYAAHLSGYLFENNHEMGRVFLPVATRTKKADTSLTDHALDWIGIYLASSGMSPDRARNISRRYATYFLDEFQKHRPDVVIIVGDTRMQSRAAVHACQELGIQHYYFEQGPFGTTILDTDGVNCTASFAKTLSTSHPVSLPGACVPPPRARFVQRKAVRALDYIMQPFFLALGFSEIREEKKFWRQLSRHIWATRKAKSGAFTTYPLLDSFVLVIGQVPTDANFSLHSPYSSFLQLIRDVEGLFPNSKVIFREHPLFIGSYGAEFYTHVATSPRVAFSRGTDLNAEIESAKHIVVVNSTAGMEVVLKHRKPLLCLGDASYSHLNGVFSRDRLEDYLVADTRISDADHAVNCGWFQSSFILGHFRDQDLRPVVSEILRMIDDS